jgi:hypothetical protein
MELASLYDAVIFERALDVAIEYNTYSHTFVRGVLERRPVLTIDGADLMPAQRSL